MDSLSAPDIWLLSLKHLLSTFASDNHSNADRAVAARILYWRYSFDFRRGHSFQMRAHEFVALNGIPLIVRVAVHGMILKRCQCTKGIPDAGPYGETMLTKCSSNGNAIITDLDSEFQLLSHTISYNRVEYIHDTVEVATMRQLALELLSEMSNYEIYRNVMGKIPFTLVHLTRTLRNAIHLYKCNHQKSRQLFIINRIVNLFANLCFDGHSSRVSRNGFQFGCCARVGGGGGDTLMDAKGADGRGWKKERCTMDFMLLIAAPCILQASDIIDDQNALHVIGRFFANALPFVSPGVLLRLVWHMPVDRLKLMAKRGGGAGSWKSVILLHRAYHLLWKENVWKLKN